MVAGFKDTYVLKTPGARSIWVKFEIFTNNEKLTTVWKLG